MNNAPMDARGIAGLGRYGDSMLVHMNPEEVHAMREMGGMTINPHTGLPEAFGWEGLLKGIGSLAAPVLGSMIPGIGTAFGAALGSSLFSGVTDKNLKKALLSGMTAYTGAKAFGGAKEAVGTAGAVGKGASESAIQNALIKDALAPGLSHSLAADGTRMALDRAVPKVGLGSLVREGGRGAFEVLSDPKMASFMYPQMAELSRQIAEEEGSEQNSYDPYADELRRARKRFEMKHGANPYSAWYGASGGQVPSLYARTHGMAEGGRVGLEGGEVNDAGEEDPFDGGGGGGEGRGTSTTGNWDASEAANEHRRDSGSTGGGRQGSGDGFTHIGMGPGGTTSDGGGGAYNEGETTTEEATDDTNPYDPYGYQTNTSSNTYVVPELEDTGKFFDFGMSPMSQQIPINPGFNPGFMAEAAYFSGANQPMYGQEQDTSKWATVGRSPFNMSETDKITADTSGMLKGIGQRFSGAPPPPVPGDPNKPGVKTKISIIPPGVGDMDAVKTAEEEAAAKAGRDAADAVAAQQAKAAAEAAAQKAATDLAVQQKAERETAANTAAKKAADDAAAAAAEARRLSDRAAAEAAAANKVAADKAASESDRIAAAAAAKRAADARAAADAAAAEAEAAAARRREEARLEAERETRSSRDAKRKDGIATLVNPVSIPPRDREPSPRDLDPREFEDERTVIETLNPREFEDERPVVGTRDPTPIPPRDLYPREFEDERPITWGSFSEEKAAAERAAARDTSAPDAEPDEVGIATLLTPPRTQEPSPRDLDLVDLEDEELVAAADAAARGAEKAAAEKAAADRAAEAARAEAEAAQVAAREAAAEDDDANKVAADRDDEEGERRAAQSASARAASERAASERAASERAASERAAKERAAAEAAAARRREEDIVAKKAGEDAADAVVERDRVAAQEREDAQRASAARAERDAETRRVEAEEDATEAANERAVADKDAKDAADKDAAAQAASRRAAAEKAAADRAAEAVAAGKAQAAAAKLAAEKAAAAKAAADKATADKAAADRVAAQKAAAEKAATERAAAERAAAQRAAAERAAAEKAAAERAAAERVSAERAAADRANRDADEARENENRIGTVSPPYTPPRPPEIAPIRQIQPETYQPQIQPEAYQPQAPDQRDDDSDMMFAAGGMMSDGGINYGMVPGSSGGMDDTVGGMTSGGSQVALSSGEFVMPADVVSMLGDGNSESGAEVLYDLMERIRIMKTGSGQQAPSIDPRSVLPR
jgi:hypothetical protein